MRSDVRMTVNLGRTWEEKLWGGKFFSPHIKLSRYNSYFLFMLPYVGWVRGLCNPVSIYNLDPVTYEWLGGGGLVATGQLVSLSICHPLPNHWPPPHVNWPLSTPNMSTLYISSPQVPGWPERPSLHTPRMNLSEEGPSLCPIPHPVCPPSYDDHDRGWVSMPFMTL